jgi:Flp pilus assembly protein TadD
MSPAVPFLIAFGQAQAPPPALYSLPVNCAAVVEPEARSSGMAQFKVGEAAILASNWADAEAALLKAVALDPLLAVAHYGLGQTYMAGRGFREAVEAFSTSRQAFHCATPSEDDLKQRTEEIRHLREAIRNADKRRLQEMAVKRKEVNGDLRTAGGKMWGVQEAERRLAELETSIKETNPAPPGVTLALGTALFQVGMIAEAEVEFRAVLARDPRSGDAHHNLALVCTITDRLDEAEREIAAAKKAGVPAHPQLVQELKRRKALKPR